ncbi:octopamine receptor 2-like [Bombyx mandarina]|uniref:G-protein coupled receptors family 1 profile domain-containing protein n=2 Tax=Bombyx TaxID=7090 RepID=A0A8R1WNZ7_BOMMO|nr:octopamine receptor 2 [Bombyx mori]XP_028029742.1 octopamine receptor 2-like [Bombyx mandarina]
MQSVLTLHPRGDMTSSWWAAAAAMAAVTFFTVGGNAAVLVALKRVNRAPAHYPLASLATADLLLGLLVLPIAAARELFVFHLNWAICSCWSTLDVLCCTASILSICTLGWERFCGITAPLARAQRAKTARLLAALIWPVATTIAIPTAFIPSPKHFLPGEIAKACTVNTNSSYVFVSIFFSFYLPASVMVVLYARILRALAAPPSIRFHRGQVTNNVEKVIPDAVVVNVDSVTPADESQENHKVPKSIVVPPSPKTGHFMIPSSETVRAITSPLKRLKFPVAGIISRQRRATRTIVMLMSLFLLCWTPFFVMLPVDSICECVRDAAWLWCTWLGYTNSALNPLVYAASSPAVSRALHASLTTTTCTRTTDVTRTPLPRRT